MKVFNILLGLFLVNVVISTSIIYIDGISLDGSAPIHYKSYQTMKTSLEHSIPIENPLPDDYKKDLLFHVGEFTDQNQTFYHYFTNFRRFQSEYYDDLPPKYAFLLNKRAESYYFSDSLFYKI